MAHMLCHVGSGQLIKCWMAASGYRHTTRGASQLPVPPPCVPAETGAEAHHGDNGDHDQSQSVPCVVSLRRTDKGEEDEPHDGRGVWRSTFGSHVVAGKQIGKPSVRVRWCQRRPDFLVRSANHRSALFQPRLRDVSLLLSCKRRVSIKRVLFLWTFSDEINVKHPLKPNQEQSCAIVSLPVT